MAEAQLKSTYGHKKKRILDMFDVAPQLSNATIAKATKTSLSYVQRLLGPNRSQQDVKRKYDILNRAGDLKGVIWKDLKKTRNDFVKAFLPTKKYEQESDFINYLLPTDDTFATTGSGEDLSGSWAQYEYLSEKRIGIGQKITKFPAEDAVREGFKLLDAKTGKVEKRPDIEQWLDDTDFLNEFATAIYYERVYGTSFLIKYYSEDDKAKGVMGTPVKASEGSIVAFEAHPPTLLTPIDAHKSNKLDKNPQKWSLMGGYYDPQRIDSSRVRVLMSRPVHSRWYGLSIWEPIWDSAIPYYQALIFLLRGFSKWGNTIVKYIIDSEEDIDTLFDKHADLIEEMKMNGTFLGVRGTEIDFQPTQLATGLRDMIEIWLEDIASGTGIPVPILMGRVVASGLGNNGYAIMERYYWNMIKKIQRSFTDDVLAILKEAGFDMTGLKIDWNLSITKTDQQRLQDELMEIEIKMAEKELKMMDLQIEEKKLSNEMMEFQHLNNILGEPENAEELQTNNKQYQDFIEIFKKKREKLRLRRLELSKQLLFEEFKQQLQEEAKT